MKRKFRESRIYDYTTKTEATAHIAAMKSKGWSVWNNNEEPHEMDECKYKYSVEFYRY